MRVAILFIALLAAPVTVANHRIYTDEQCLSSAIYYEATGESLAGKKAVAEVIQNRSRVYGMSTCQVVRAKGQFSWFPKKRIKKFDKKMQDLLTEVNEYPTILNDESYLYFYSGRIKPVWANKMSCRLVGNQRFCKPKGKSTRRKNEQV